MKLNKLPFLLFFFFLYFAAYAQNPYRIPVVVHVIHYDGSENISDAQIKNGIQILTRNWRKQNPDTLEIVPVFKPIAADMEVEFELAKFDPDGNCTNGINRIRSNFSLTGTHNVKSLVHWPPDKYLNIYVVRDAAGLAGHALMPFQADSIPAWDGIVIAGGYFGNIGTSNDVQSVVLSHEVGHYLNLYHIWGGNNVPEFYYLPVGQQANCAVGDSVSDTPNTKGWSTCNLNGTTCDGMLDNVQNFMDYAYCARMFTQGQKQRVHAALNSSVANRNNLWSALNLSQTGLSVDAPLCAADFYSDRRIHCVNDTVKLYDASYHDPISWAWNVGINPSLSGANVSYVYSLSGKYDVSLVVSDGTEQQNLVRPGYLKILEQTGQSLPYVEGFEDHVDLLNSPLFTECEGNFCFDVVSGTSASGEKSVVLQNHSINAPLAYKLTTPRLDFSATPDPVIRFKYAFAQKDTTNTDRLLIRLSKDCGKTWLTKRTISSAELATVPALIGTPFTPAPSEFEEVLITGIPNSYKTNNVIVRFEFYAGGGNNLYLDDINIFDLSQLSLPVIDSKDWRIAPNPAYDAFRVEGPFDNQSVDVFDMNGRFVWSQTNISSGQEIRIDDLAAGIYHVKLSHQGVETIRKLIVIK